MTKDFRNMSSDMPISELSRVLERQNFVFVDSTHIVSSYDVLDFMNQKTAPEHRAASKSSLGDNSMGSLTHNE